VTLAAGDCCLLLGPRHVEEDATVLPVILTVLKDDDAVPSGLLEQPLLALRLLLLPLCLGLASVVSIIILRLAGKTSFRERAITASMIALSSASGEVTGATSFFSLRRLPPPWPPSSGSRLTQTKWSWPRRGDGPRLSRMTIPPPQPRLSGGETGSGLRAWSWVIGLAGRAEPEECKRNTDPEDDDMDAIRRGIQEFPRRRENDVGVLGGICRMGEFPAWMWSWTTERVWPRALHDNCKNTDQL
jgi:hypothetical protein